MIIQKFKKGLATIVSSTLITLFSVQPALSAPLTLPSAPLFLSSIVEPNVFFTLDDSGSMDNVFLVREIYDDADAITAAGTISTLGGQPLNDNGEYIGYFHPTWPKLYNGDRVLPPSNGTQASFDKYWVFRNHNGNKLYYNSETTYKPWAGTKADGTAMYTDADPANALKDPNVPGGNSTDLTATLDFTDRNGTLHANSLYLPTFFTWQDDGDGIIETGDPHTMYEIKSGITFPSGRSYTEELQNFANWFVYYRSRNNAAKASIGQVINNTDATRMGMDFFNGTIARKDLERMTDLSLKRALLEHFYSLVIPARGTPARTSLQKVGNYFADSSSGAILSATDGGECQQNFNILLSDGFWNGGTSPGVGNTDIDGAGEFDGDADQSIDGGKYDDTQSNTLADVAMHYYETDLRTDLDNNVPTAAADKAPHQHLVNFSISFGLTGNSFGAGNAFDSSNTDPATLAGFEWPDVGTDAGKSR